MKKKLKAIHDLMTIFGIRNSALNCSYYCYYLGDFTVDYHDMAVAMNNYIQKYKKYDFIEKIEQSTYIGNYRIEIYLHNEDE